MRFFLVAYRAWSAAPARVAASVGAYVASVTAAAESSGTLPPLTASTVAASPHSIPHWAFGSDVVVPPRAASLAGLSDADDRAAHLGAEAPAAPVGGPSSGVPVAETTAARIAALFPTLVLGKQGVPKSKLSPYQKRKTQYGIHFKHRYMRLQPWYHCPLCAEPKTEGSYCRKEECRQLKP
jgi:hypothetical protein